MSAAAQALSQPAVIRRTVYVINICPNIEPPMPEWLSHRDYGTLRIPHPLPGQRYTSTAYEPRYSSLDTGVTSNGVRQMFPIELPGEAVANDIVRDFAKWGVFISDSPTPSEAELQKAEARLRAYFERMVLEGDAIWSKYERIELIEDDSKRAVKFLGLERPWAFHVPQRIEKSACPWCDGQTSLDVVKCQASGCILDLNRALAGGLINKVQADEMEAARALLKKGKK
jgi:hypothetical protein